MFYQNPYIQLMRLDKPIGIWLLLIPCLWGVWIAPLIMVQPVSIIELLYKSVLFLIASTIMRSAGCVINDYFDRDFDKKVSRTLNRPLASGVIKPRNALILFVILSLIGLCLLVQLPFITIMIGCFTFIPIVLYPLMKRLTYFPQLFLGLIYNSGIIMGFVSISCKFNADILWLYACGVLITLAYDTIYAFQDIQDDIKIGIKSSAIIWKHNPKLWIGLCYTLALINFGIFFCNIVIACILLILAFIIGVKLYYWHITDIQQALKLFKSNVYLLMCLWFLILIFSYYLCNQL